MRFLMPSRIFSCVFAPKPFSSATAPDSQTSLSFARSSTASCVQSADLLRSEAGDLHDLEEAGGNGRLELLVERQDAVAAERRDLIDERLAQARDVGQLAAVDEPAEVFGEVLEDAGARGVGADLERVLARQLHEGGDLVEDRRDVGLLHHGRRAFSAW